MRQLLFILSTLTLACAATKPQEKNLLEPKDQKLILLKYEEKTRELLDTSQKLNGLRGEIDDQRRRLTVICADYPDHQVCQPQTEAMYARKAFCDDPEFTKHVDQVVSACHEGECKQLDQAEQITRAQYMLLTTRLPHSLVLFNAAKSILDRNDKRQLQQFFETIRGEKGYVVIVGRASRDGNWRKNIVYALQRAENTRRFLVNDLGLDPNRVGFITYGEEKMYLTELDAERLSEKKLTTKQANRSALVFSYPCYEGADAPY